MSWDKNTIVFSALSSIKELLDDLNVPYQLSVITRVRGRGINDGAWDEETWYDLRRLQFGDFAILENIEQDVDCDTDDIILSHKFELTKEPKDWKPIIQTDKTGQYSDETHIKQTQV